VRVFVPQTRNHFLNNSYKYTPLNSILCHTQWRGVSWKIFSEKSQEMLRDRDVGGGGPRKLFWKSTDVTLMNNFIPKNRFEQFPPVQGSRLYPLFPSPLLCTSRLLNEFVCGTDEDKTRQYTYITMTTPNGIMQKFCC